MTFFDKVARVIAPAVAAIAAMTSATGIAQTQTTLKFISFVGEKAVAEWYAGVAREFERAHPGVKIEYTRIEQASYNDTLTTLFASGRPSDIVHLAAFDFPKFAENGWLENLDPYIARSKLDLKGWAGQAKCSWSGKTYCLVNQYFGFILAYNQQLLAKEGLAPPTTYEEFLNAARKTTKDLNNDGIIDQFGTGFEITAGTGWYLTEMLDFMLDTGAFWTDANGKVTIDTPQMVEALRRWKLFHRENLIPRDPKPGDTREFFLDGKIAMKVDGPWLAAALNRAKPDVRDNVKFAPAPFKVPVGGTSNVLAMAAEIPQKHKELVWEFLTLAASDRQQTLYQTQARTLSSNPRADIEQARAVNAAFDVLHDSQQRAAKAGIDRIPTGLELQYNEFGKMIQEEAQRMIIQDLPPEAVATTMQRRAVKIQKDQ